MIGIIGLLIFLSFPLVIIGCIIAACTGWFIKCPNCSIGLWKQMGTKQFCNRCKHIWTLEPSTNK